MLIELLVHTLHALRALHLPRNRIHRKRGTARSRVRPRSIPQSHPLGHQRPHASCKRSEWATERLSQPSSREKLGAVAAVVVRLWSCGQDMMGHDGVGCPNSYAVLGPPLVEAGGLFRRLSGACALWCEQVRPGEQQSLCHTPAPRCRLTERVDRA